MRRNLDISIVDEYIGVAPDRTFWFNPPTRAFINSITNKWEYTTGFLFILISKNRSCNNIVPLPFNYGINRDFTNNARPSNIKPIIGDGNCGYRSLSAGISGTEINHSQIRADIINFLQSEVSLHRNGVDGHDWWRKFYIKLIL